MERWAFSVFVLFSFIINNIFCGMLFNDVHEIENVDVDIQHHGLGRHRRSSENPEMPHSVSLHVHTSNGKKTLRLKRNVMNGIPHVRVTRNGKSEDVTAMVAQTLQASAHYQDPRTGASIVLTRPPASNSSEYGIFGSFYDENLKYGIEPHVGVGDGNLKHRVGLLKAQEAVLQEETIKKIIEKEGKEKIIAELEKRARKKTLPRQKRRASESQKALVETGFYIGVTEYEYFSDILNSDTNSLPNVIPTGTLGAETGSASDLEIAFLTLYVGYLNNEVDLRLSSFEEDAEARDFQCRTLFAYLHIFAEAPAIDSEDYWENSVERLGKLSGDSFQSSAEDGGYQADFDLHIAISRLQYVSQGIAALDAFVAPKDPDNVAFCRMEPESSVCLSSNNFCHASDLPNTNLVVALSKAVGIALSARFDNVGTIECATDLNVMTPNFEFPMIANRSEPWKFSSCSVESIVNEVQAAFLGDPSLECLTEEIYSPFIDLNETVYGGQVFGGDAQCEMHLGAGSVVCREDYVDGTNLYENICFEGLSCLNAETGECEATLFPLDDTQCGNGRMCFKGVCSPSVFAAATASDNCPFGDDPATNCSIANCTDPSVRDFICCETCAADTIPEETTTTTTTTTTAATTTTTPTTTTTTAATTTTTPTTTTTTAATTTTTPTTTTAATTTTTPTTTTTAATTTTTPAPTSTTTTSTTRSTTTTPLTSTTTSSTTSPVTSSTTSSTSTTDAATSTTIASRSSTTPLISKTTTTASPSTSTTSAAPQTTTSTTALPITESSRTSSTTQAISTTKTHSTTTSATESSTPPVSLPSTTTKDPSTITTSTTSSTSTATAAPRTSTTPRQPSTTTGTPSRTSESTSSPIVTSSEGSTSSPAATSTERISTTTPSAVSTAESTSQDITTASTNELPSTTTEAATTTTMEPDRLPILPTEDPAPGPSDSSSSSDEAKKQIARHLVRARLRRLFRTNKHFRGLFSDSYPAHYHNYLHHHHHHPHH